MTDNARIVREALDGAIQGILADQWDAHPSLDLRDKKKLEDALLPNFDDVYVALTALETELATAKADLERAREEEASARFFVACMVCAKGGEFYIPFSIQESLNKDCILHRIEDHENRITRLILSNRAALAPEQKG